MHISNESLLVILVVGLVAGWLAGQIVRGAGFGLIGDLAIGIVGAFIGDLLLPRIGIHLGAGIVSSVINATIGAVLLLLLVRLWRGGGKAGIRYGLDVFPNSRHGFQFPERDVYETHAAEESWSKVVAMWDRNLKIADVGRMTAS